MPVSADKVVALTFASAAMARGGRHHHDGIIGKAGQAHSEMTLIGSIRSDWRMWALSKNPTIRQGLVLGPDLCRDLCHRLFDAGRRACHRRAVALYPLLRPLAFALDAERAHRLTIRALKLLPAGQPAAARSDAGGRGCRARLPQSGRARRRLRQGCRGVSADARLRLRLRRGGHADPAAAGGQSEAAPVPARRGRGGDQPDGVQQSRARPARAGAAGEAATGRRGSSASISAPTRTAPTGSRDYAAGVRAMLGARRLSHGQHLLAQHAGPARRCRTKARWTRCWRQ